MNTRLIGLAVLSIAGTCRAQWWWPPTDGLSVSPECISAGNPATLTLAGTWPDSCIPNVSSTQVSVGAIDFYTGVEPPPGGCLTVLRPWSRTEVTAPLGAGVYTVYATHIVGGQTVHPRTQVGTVTVVAVCDPGCYPNCDGSTQAPVLTANDFQCFLNKFAAGTSYANCDGSTGNPALTANDLQCFINKYAAGCR